MTSDQKTAKKAAPARNEDERAPLGPRPWDRRSDESAHQYEAFVTYCGSPGRELRYVAKATSWTYGTIKNWSARLDWRERAEAWDRALGGGSSGLLRRIEDRQLEWAAGILAEIETGGIGTGYDKGGDGRPGPKELEAARKAVATIEQRRLVPELDDITDRVRAPRLPADRPKAS
ncbi:hypothetical protein [Streptomyces albireticuli]|uniref:Uncharacterized protein n=1 Tax=Streptomyces albireticuli TaxID=1940 RepID=A0A2A2D1A9_9ACTN|nr:hypothetical protein [Streptomyces albireticuli]MCD9145922.1 hypothetical protein [Streptomyces albireticuli]MCD9166092.1 hypothetical protein [Streptomyces albireticuli]MCD9196372.1 hypothetical protein [Streptomyces albireticuli]PAU45301.1 hypothetical protein CK936_30270 [Streptomyces albireticuli]